MIDAIAIEKSSNHSKIIGNLGEHLVCNWLSRSGFEVAIVDHTGIDIIAFNPKNQRRLGITVKSRTRNKGKETSAVNLFRQNKKKPDKEKLEKACEAFECEPWIGVYVETTEYADLFLTSLNNFEENHLKNPEDSAYADYLLLDSKGLPLAVVEAKRTSKDPILGQRQAEGYVADIKQQTGKDTFIFFD